MLINGRELAAEDVKFTSGCFLTGQGNAARYMLGPADRIEVVDRYTVRFHLTEPYVWFINALASPRSTWTIAPEVVQQCGMRQRKSTTCIPASPWSPHPGRRM